MKKVIWDLFGGGCNSLHKSLDLEKYEIYTFDIVNTFKTTIVFDLSQDNIINKLLELKLPTPDYIVASPLCQSFSKATGVRGGNACWKKTHKGLEITSKERLADTRYDYKKQYAKAILGQECITNTIKIINYFKPKFWYIENPEFSLIWDFISLNLKWNEGIRNIAYYGNYGLEFKKPTCFLSNRKLDLKHEPGKFKSFEMTRQGINRSEIPHELIKEIFKQIEEKK